MFDKREAANPHSTARRRTLHSFSGNGSFDARYKTLFTVLSFKTELDWNSWIYPFVHFPWVWSIVRTAICLLLFNCGVDNSPCSVLYTQPVIH